MQRTTVVGSWKDMSFIIVARSSCQREEMCSLKYILSCVQEPPMLRFIIAFSAGATLLYTPILKRMTAVKNIAVAAVIALSPIAGALAAGGVRTTKGSLRDKVHLKPCHKMAWGDPGLPGGTGMLCSIHTSIQVMCLVTSRSRNH